MQCKTRTQHGIALLLALALCLQMGCALATRTKPEPEAPASQATLVVPQADGSATATFELPTRTPTRTATSTVDVLARMATLDAILPSPTPLGLGIVATARPGRTSAAIATLSPPQAAPTRTPAPVTLIPTLTSLPTATGTASPTPPTSRLVTYRVVGSTHWVLVSFRNRTGGHSERLVRVPWSTSFRMPTGNTVHLRAENWQAHGSVVAQILLDGQAWWQARSAGPYVVASCGGIVE